MSKISLSNIGAVHAGRTFLRRDGIRFRRSSVLILIGLVSASVSAQRPTSGRLLNQRGILYSESTGKIYVVNEAGDSVRVIDAAGTVKSITVPAGPEALAINHKTGDVCVASSIARSVTLIDGQRDEILVTVELLKPPYSLAVDDATGDIYVPDNVVIDGRTHAVKTVALGSADILLTDAARQKVFLMGYESGIISVFDMKTDAVKQLPTGGSHLWGMTQIGHTLYVNHLQGASIAAINVDTGNYVLIPTGPMPCALAVSVESGLLFTANYGDGSITVIDTGSKRVAGTIHIGGRLQAIATDAESGVFYVADVQNRKVFAIDVKTRRSKGVANLSESPYALVVNQRTHAVYAATMGPNGFIQVFFPKEAL
jgi:DNA-binding beta-propeller fold protein YncE